MFCLCKKKIHLIMIDSSASELHFLAGRLGNILEFGIILPKPSGEIREKQVRGGDFGQLRNISA